MQFFVVGKRIFKNHEVCLIVKVDTFLCSVAHYYFHFDYTTKGMYTADYTLYYTALRIEEQSNIAFNIILIIDNIIS
jgi:hypothetical protein